MDTLSRAQHLYHVAGGYVAADCLIRAAERLEKAAALFRQVASEREVDPAGLCIKRERAA